MDKTNGLAIWRATAEALSGGRTLSEQEETIRKYGNHGTTPLLRAGVLGAMGIDKPRDEAKNCIIFGCYRPFTTPFLVRDYIRLLDLLGVEYTYLDQEQCCGAPLAMLASEAARGQIMAAGEEFNRHNFDLARKKGAVNLAYCCAGCVHAAKNTFQESAERHLYLVDLLFDALEGKNLKIPPTVMGYFEGCHTFFRTVYPAAHLDWDRYPRRLADIEGLELVELPKKMCCKISAAKIIDKAERMNLRQVLCPCNWCHTSLQQAARSGVQLVSLPELLLRALEI